MSSALPARPSGVWAMKVFASSGLAARTCAFSGVSMRPGPIALTRTPSLPSSAASARVKPRTPCFGRGIGGRVRRPYMHERLDRTDIDDPAFAGAQLRQKRVRHIENTVQVGRQDILPVRNHRL